MSAASNIRICSWDVGIKNLAYCIMDWDKTNFRIIKWDIISISDEESNICSEVLKNQKICGRKAIWYNEDHFYCNTHKDNYTLFNIVEDEYSTKIDKEQNVKHKCSYINKNDKECPSNGSFKFKNGDIYCSAHNKSKLSMIRKNLELKQTKKNKSYKQGVQSLAEVMVSKLDEIKELMTVDEVYIENQPTMINPTMKTISAFLYQYFIIRGKIDNKCVGDIRFISPSNKLKINEDRTLEVLTKAKNEGKTYKMTKQLGIKYTLIMLNDGINDEWINHLNSYKKKDDLCDAFLQGYYCLFKK